MNPFITIITVVYNGSKTLEQTIQSVISQKYDNFEYIVIDGRSTDGTVDIIKKYEADIATWISEKDKGIYDAMNKGIRYAKGAWIYFLGADDLLRENILHDISGFLTDERCIYYGNVKYIMASRIYDGKFGMFKLATRNISHQAIFYPAKVFEKEIYQLEYKYLADYVLNLKMFKFYRFNYLPMVIADYNDTGASASNIDTQFISDRFKILKEVFPFYVYGYARIRTFLKKVIKNG